jgi:hypothetical protein
MSDKTTIIEKKHPPFEIRMHHSALDIRSCNEE